MMGVEFLLVHVDFYLISGEEMKGVNPKTSLPRWADDRLDHR